MSDTGYEVLLDHYRLACEARKDAERQAEGWRQDCIAARDQRDAARAEVERLRAILVRGIYVINYLAPDGLAFDFLRQIKDALSPPPNPERSGSEADRSRELLGDSRKAGHPS